MFFQEYCEIFKNTYFEKHLQKAASKTDLVNTKLFITRKITRFRPLRLKYLEMNQTTPKYQIDFWAKFAKKVYNKKSEHQNKILHLQISLLLSA